MGDVHPQPVDDAQVPADAALPRPLLRDPPPPPGYTNPLEESDLLEELFSAEKRSVSGIPNRQVRSTPSRPPARLGSAA